MRIRPVAVSALPALVAVAGALLAPGLAEAKQNRGGDRDATAGGTTTTTPAPAPTAASCATVEALNTGAIDKIGSRKRVNLQFQVGSCSTTTFDIGLRIVPTVYTSFNNDLRLCPGPAFGGNVGTLTPGKRLKLNAPATVPYCGYSPWGTAGSYMVGYDVEAIDRTTGALLATTFSGINHTGGR